MWFLKGRNILKDFIVYFKKLKLTNQSINKKSVLIESDFVEDIWIFAHPSKL